MSAVHTLLVQDRLGPKFQPLPVSILKFRSSCGFSLCVNPAAERIPATLKLKAFYSADLSTVHKPNTENVSPTTCHT